MKLSQHVNQLREQIEAAFNKELAILGLGPETAAEAATLTDPKESARRARFDAMLANHQGETGDYPAARAKLIDELTFTLFNRLAALKVMEAAQFFPHVLARPAELGNRSAGHRAWLEADPARRNRERDGLRDYLKEAFDQLGSSLPLYRRDYPYALLPGVDDLDAIIEAFNAVETDPDTAVKDGLWSSDDVLGWLYESYNNAKKQAFKDSGDDTEYDKVSLQSQVYTPRWVVQFLVENSLGKLYLEMYPDSALARSYKIANVRSQGGGDERREVKPLHAIKLIDPAVGSGNFLLYAFDLFYAMYEDQIENYDADYDEDAIARLIIEHNLHGIDLDDRAVQIAQLGLYIKARKKRSNIGQLNFRIVSSDFYLPDYEAVRPIFEEGATLDKNRRELIAEIWEDLKLAYKFGSLIQLEEKLNRKVGQLLQAQQADGGDLFAEAEVKAQREFVQTLLAQLRAAAEQHARSSGNSFLAGKTRDAVTFLELLSQRYDVATANPPYTDSADFGDQLATFVQKHYQKPHKFHTNLYATFIKRCYDLTGEAGKIAMIHPHTFMFIKTFEGVRKFIIENTNIDCLVDLGLDRVNLFGPGILLDAAFYVLSKQTDHGTGAYFNLTNNLQEKFKKGVFLEALDHCVRDQPHERLYSLPQAKLKIIKSWPFIYWISDSFREKFKGDSVKDLLTNCQGLATADNNRFLRFWWELESTFKQDPVSGWFLYAKGGPFQKWSGNLWLLVNWKNNGKEIRSLVDANGKQRSRTQNEEYYFKEGVTYSASGSKGPSYRILPKGCIFDVGGSSIFPVKKYKNNAFILALFNSSLSHYIIDCLNPTVNKQVGDVERIPFQVPSQAYESIIELLAISNIKIFEKIQRCSIIDANFRTISDDLKRSSSWLAGLNSYLTHENHLQAQVLLNEALINEKIFEVYELNEHDKAMVLAKEGPSIGGLPVCPEARAAYLAETEATREFPLDGIRDFIEALPEKTFSAEERQAVEAGFPALYQSNNDLESFCTRHQINPINVWYWFRESGVIPPQRQKTLAMEFLADLIREILMEDEDGIVPLVPNAGQKVLLDLLQRKFNEKGFSDAQFSSFDKLLGRPLADYLNRHFFGELSDHLNLFMYLPKTPFIWHLSSGPEAGFDCYLIIYKWSRDKLHRLKSHYLENRERALENRLRDLADNESAEAQTEKDRIARQLFEIRGSDGDPDSQQSSFKGKIDALLAEGYDPVLDSGVGKNIAPLQKHGMLAYQGTAARRYAVLNPGQLRKYLAADW